MVGHMVCNASKHAINGAYGLYGRTNLNSMCVLFSFSNSQIGRICPCGRLDAGGRTVFP